MIIKILNTSEPIPFNFITWASVDLVCPQCGRSGLVIKYRYNGRMGLFHSSSGIILACDKWDGKCCSVWNKEKQGRHYPWHTWLSSFHRCLDLARGSFGKSFLNSVKKEYPPVYTKILKINNEINEMMLYSKKINEPIKIKTDFQGINKTMENY